MAAAQPRNRSSPGEVVEAGCEPLPELLDPADLDSNGLGEPEETDAAAASRLAARPDSPPLRESRDSPPPTHHLRRPPRSERSESPREPRSESLRGLAAESLEARSDCPPLDLEASKVTTETNSGSKPKPGTGGRSTGSPNPGTKRGPSSCFLEVGLSLDRRSASRSPRSQFRSRSRSRIRWSMAD
jgi:hypothetical protein